MELMLIKNLKKITTIISKINQNLPEKTGIEIDSYDRNQIICETKNIAKHNKSFAKYVSDADRMRDSGQWLEAGNLYAKALEMFPYHSGYWVQYGHVLKEQERFIEAEIAYRSACAFGAAPEDVLEHLQYIIRINNVNEEQYPIRFYKPYNNTYEQIPGQPDVEVLAWLAWQTHGIGIEDTLLLLRKSANCDDLLANIIEDFRFEQHNRDWLDLFNERNNNE